MKTNVNTGLTNEEVIYSRRKHGTNEIRKDKKNSFMSLFIESLGDPIIKILIIALAIKLIFLFSDSNYFETIGILIAILIASFISSISEYGSEKAFEKLEEESSKINVKVKRNNNIVLVPINELVVGDIVFVSTGDKIPADGIIVDGFIKLDESSLTGESIEVEKKIGEKVFRGSVVTEKNAIVLVNDVGKNTFYGDLANELLDKSPESPLKTRLRDLAKVISLVGYVGAFLVAISYLFKVIIINNNFSPSDIYSLLTNYKEMFSILLHTLTLAVTIIVVAVPEGLPMMITLVLSSNMKRMIKSNVLIRKLTGIETAGSLNILYTDKTGTITKGTLDYVGTVLGNKELLNNYDSKYYQILKESLIYNNECTFNNKNEIIGGNSTDRAIAKHFKNDYSYSYKIISEIPFDSEKKYSTVTIDKNGKTTYIKGAYDILIKDVKYYLTSTGEKKLVRDKKDLLDTVNSYSKKGIRVILTGILQEKSITLIGFVLLKDIVREDAIEGLKQVSNAGIQTIMLTGDNKDTAVSIAKEVGLLTSNSDIVLTSDELKNISDNKLKIMLPNIKLIARSLPSDKTRLVKISQELGLVVGMTGDGVNDAPALKKSDVGFSMGSGTEVSKEASDIIILDDNFLSISKAILFGRTIFKSIRKFIIFQLSINFLAISLSVVGPFIGIETPVTIMQMLWINMVMDTLAALAFSFEAPRREYMNELPKKRDEKILNNYMINEIVLTGLYSVVVCIFFLKSNIINNFYLADINNAYLLTSFFGLFIFMAIFNLFNVRTHRLNIINNITKNKVFIFIIIVIAVVQIYLLYYGGELFRTTGINFQEFILMLLISFSIIPFDLLRKLLLKKQKKNIGV